MNECCRQVIPPLLRVDGPYGSLSMRYQRYGRLLLIGGGVGITPLLAILKDVYQLDMSAAAKAKVMLLIHNYCCIITMPLL